MIDETAESADQAAREEREADLVSNRVGELYESPVQGQFDTAHLKAVHAYLFQDLPHHRPGIVREDMHDSWIKLRTLEGHSTDYVVHYAHEGIEARITGILGAFGGSGTLKGLSLDAAASRIASLYGDLDHAHGFHEGNSRTLREFTRELAAAAGHMLNWIKTSAGSKERNQLYLARDIAVLERAFPGLTPERAMATDDRSEYEASFVLTRLRRAAGERTLEAIVRDGMTPHRRS